MISALNYPPLIQHKYPIRVHNSRKPVGCQNGGLARHTAFNRFLDTIFCNGIKSGSGTPNTNKVGKVSREQLEEIARAKDPDLTAADMDAAVRTIAGSARAMGLEVEGVN